MTFKPKILLVDEDIQSNRALKKLLDPSIFDVDYTSDIETAFNKVNKEEYHIVIADQMTPKTAGMELLSKVKKKAPTTVGILMSSYGDVDMIVSGVNDGSIYHCITKPWDNFSMLGLINNALDSFKEQKIKQLVSSRLLETIEDWNNLLNEMQLILGNSVSNKMELLSRIIFIKDEKLYNHSVQVAVLAQRVADELKLSSNRKLDLKYGCLFHEIGKLTQRDSVKNKSILDIQNYQDIRRHPEIGAEIISSTLGLERAAIIIMQHHEREDGMGYPNGLKSSQLLLESKIFPICNIYEILTSDSIYRLGLDKYEALKVIKEGIGTFYNKDVVNSFIKTIIEN